MIARRSVLLLPLLGLGCSEEAAPESFPFPSYSYLTPIRLNVASLEIDDRSPPPSDGSLETFDPLRPVDALKRMASDRLSADGSAGRAVFVIDQAQLRRDDAGVDGTMAVHLDVFAGLGGERVGYAEAKVVRRRTSTDAGEDLRAVLYNFTIQMMNDMNVEFEYQVRRSLRDWVQATAGSAPLPPPVEAQPLPGADGGSGVSPVPNDVAPNNPTFGSPSQPSGPAQPPPPLSY